jgi:hypothetical protein
MNGDELSGLDGGTIFDSGTSFTYLVPEVYKTLLAVVSIDHIPLSIVDSTFGGLTLQFTN